MNVLVARLGLAESRAAALGRGSGRRAPVKNAVSGGCWRQLRKSSGKRKMYGNNLGVGEFGVGEEETRIEKSHAGANSPAADGHDQSDPFRADDKGNNDHSDKVRRSRSSVSWAAAGRNPKVPQSSASVTWKPSFLEMEEPKPKGARSEFFKRPPRAAPRDYKDADDGLLDRSMQAFTPDSKDAGADLSDCSTEAVTKRMLQLLNQAEKGVVDNLGDDFDKPAHSVGNEAPVEVMQEPRFEDFSADLSWSQSSQDDIWALTSGIVEDEPATSPPQEDLPRDLPEQNKEGQSNHIEPVWTDDTAEGFRKIDYKVELPVALECDDHDTVARCLYAAQTNADLDFLKGIPESTFTQILEALQFRHSMGEMTSARLYMSDRMAAEIGLERIDQTLWAYGKMLLDISRMRKNSGHRLTDAQYRILLGSAKDGGDKTLALGIWRQMYEDGIAPDVSMYNAFLGAFVWAGINDVQERRRQRVIVKNLSKRAEGRKTRPYHYYRVGRNGVRQRSMAILKAMLKDGLTANEESYRLMITGAAREGAMDDVKSILLKVWNIDVDALMTAGLQETQRLEPRKMQIGDPQHPTADLLFTLAHAFSINNDVPAALRVVDFVAQSYELTMNEETWSLLFEWTFVLTSRSRSNKYPDSDQGALPYQAVTKMWDTMTNAPYFVKPDIDMYDRLMKTLYLQQSHTGMEAKMLEALPLYVEITEIRDEAWYIMMRSLWNSNNGIRPEVPVTEARRKWEQATVVHGKHYLLIKRWILLYLAGFGRWAAQDTRNIGISTDRIVRTLPRMLWDWREFVKSNVFYETQTGLVQIEFRSEADMLRNAPRRERHYDIRYEVARQAPYMINDKWALQGEGTSRRLQKARDEGLVPEREPVFQLSVKENLRLGKLVQRMERLVKGKRIRREREAQKGGHEMRKGGDQDSIDEVLP